MRCAALAALLIAGLCCQGLQPLHGIFVLKRLPLRALSGLSRAGIASAVSRKLSRMAKTPLSGVVCSTCLISGRPQVRTRVVQGSVERSKLQDAALAHRLPAEVASRLEALAFSRSVAFQTFTFEVNTLVWRGHYETYIGAGRRLDDSSMLEFSVVHSVASAQLVAKATPVQRRKCKRRFFIKRCRSWTESVPRGLTADELRQVEETMRQAAVSSATSHIRLFGSGRSGRSAEETDIANEFDLE